MISFKEILTIIRRLLGSKEEELEKQIQELDEQIKKLEDEKQELSMDNDHLKSRIKILEELQGDGDIFEEPAYLGRTNSIELHNLLDPYCETVYHSDLIYRLTSVSEAKIYCEKTKVAIKEYKKYKRDCDEFSFALMGYWNLDLYQFAFGIAWSKKHAFNIMIDDKKQIWIVEPQSNKFIKIEDTKNNEMYYPLKLIII